MKARLGVFVCVTCLLCMGILGVHWISQTNAQNEASFFRSVTDQASSMPNLVKFAIRNGYAIRIMFTVRGKEGVGFIYAPRSTVADQIKWPRGIAGTKVEHLKVTENFLCYMYRYEKIEIIPWEQMDSMRISSYGPGMPYVLDLMVSGT